MQVPSLPFKILALGPFRPFEERVWKQDPVSVDKTNIDAVLKNLNPSLEIPLSIDRNRSLGLTVPFKRVKDFFPSPVLPRRKLPQRDYGSFGRFSFKRRTLSKSFLARGC